MEHKKVQIIKSLLKVGKKRNKGCQGTHKNYDVDHMCVHIKEVVQRNKLFVVLQC